MLSEAERGVTHARAWARSAARRRLILAAIAHDETCLRRQVWPLLDDRVRELGPVGPEQRDVDRFSQGRMVDAYRVSYEQLLVRRGPAGLCSGDTQRGRDRRALSRL